MRSTVVWEGVEREQLRRRRHSMDRAQPGQRPDPSQPPGTDRLPQIKHIVVLMMENHSFDNYLGTLGRGDGFSLGADGQPDAANPDVSGQPVRAYHRPSTVQESGVPSQSWRAAHTQFAGGKMTGFVAATQEEVPKADKAAAVQ
jgi:phospholipase C